MKPLVRQNDWSVLAPPALGAWTPERTVSVVLPSWGGRHLPWVLAALAAQSYPQHLTEVLVVDDGNPEPLTLPEIRPENTRIVRVAEGWGRAGASKLGMESAEGEVIVWLDDDMLPFGDHVEAHARWHHRTDHAVVMGVKRFVDPVVPWTPQETFRAAQDGSLARMHDWDSGVRHEWVEEIWDATDQLRAGGLGGFRCFVSSTASLTKEMIAAAGPVNPLLRLGEDTEYGHRLAQAGAVLVADDEARTWHLGNTHAMEHAEIVNRYNQPAFADRVPSLRRRRAVHGRVYAVPYVEVVITANGPLREVQRAVDAVLDADLSDLRILFVGAWDTVTHDRVSPLQDPLRDLGILHRRYQFEPRVQLVTPDATELRQRPEATFRLVVGRCDVAPVVGALRAWTDDLERARLGLRVFTDESGTPVARLERVAAFARAEWHDVDHFSRPASVDASPADPLVGQAFGVASVPALTSGWVPWRSRNVRRERRVDVEPIAPEQSWAEALNALGLGAHPAQHPATDGVQASARGGLLSRLRRG